METILLTLLPSVIAPIITELLKRLAPKLGDSAWKLICTLLGAIASAATSVTVGAPVTPESVTVGATAGAAGTLVYDAARSAGRYVMPGTE